MLKSNYPPRDAVMSRKGQLKTPKRALVEEMGSDDDALVTSGRTSGRVEHLGSDLPDPPKDYEELEDATVGADDTNMGQEQSREQVRARGDAMRQAARDIRQLPSTGKLQTARKQLVEARFGKQRALTGPRLSTYDDLRSPEKTPMRPRTNSKAAKRDISPRKQQRALWKQSEVEREQERQRQLDEQLGSSEKQPEEEAADAVEEEELLDAEEVEELEEAQAAAGSSGQDITETQALPVEAKRRPGRPRKIRSTGGRSRKSNSVTRALSKPSSSSTRPSQRSRDQRSPGNDDVFPPSSGMFGKAQLKNILQPKPSQSQRRSQRVQQNELQLESTTAGPSTDSTSRRPLQRKQKQSSQRSQVYINDVSDRVASNLPVTEASEPVEPLPAKTITLRNEDVVFEPNQNLDSTNVDSEYQPRQEDAEEDAADGSDGGQAQGSHTAKSSKKRRAPATASGSRSKQPVKRTKPSEPDTEDDEDESSEEISADSQRLFGHWASLQKVVRAAKKSQYTKAQANNPEFEAFVSRCDKLGIKMQSSAPSDDEADDEIVITDMAAIINVAEDLCSEGTFKHRSNELDWGCDCFALLLPSMVRLLGELVVYLEREDIRPSGTTQMRLDDLDAVFEMARQIDRMERETSKNFDADPKNPMRLKFKQRIVTPLRRVVTDLEKTRRRLVAAAAAARRAERQARQAAIDEAAQARRDAEDNYIKGLEKEWHALHHLRIGRQGFALPHLRYPQCYVERDANGQPFSRLPMFGKVRVGPSPGMIAEAESRWGIWTEFQVYQLRQGLRYFADQNQNTLRGVIEWLCSRQVHDDGSITYGALRQFSVTDIAVMAARLREEMIWESERDGEEVKEWVIKIPVWTKPHAWGQENEGASGIGEEREEGDVNGSGEPEVIDAEESEEEES